MFSTTSSSATGPGSKTIAANALRNAGLIDKDAQMRDVNDKPGGRKGVSKIRSHRNRPIDVFKDQPGSHRLASRISSSASHAGPSDPLAIRGAARPTATGRLRRNAVSTGGASTSIVGGPRVSIGRSKAIESWREVVRKRWNADAQFLNLESLIDDELVKKYNLSSPGIGGGSAKEAGVIFKLASELKPPIKTLSLANNKLAGEHLQYLSKYLPKLENLSLQNNNLCHWKDLDYISARKDKLVHLRELVLLDNPVRDMEIKNGRVDRYKHELIRRFTSLEVLDQEPVAKIGFDVPQGKTSVPVKKPSATTFPFDMNPPFVTGVDPTLVPNFLVRFYNLFDTQREGLVDAYDPRATFSFSVNTTIPSRARIQAFHHSKEMPNQRKLEWSPWLAGGSRNLTRIAGGLGKTIQSLHIGGEAVVKAIKSLPGTRHDLSGPPEKFCLDAFPVPIGQDTGLLVTLHGQFTEVGTEGIRSFDRTFVLAPAPEGSRARLNGWDVMILSDQWTIRIYSSHEAWKPGPMLVQALPKSSTSTSSSIPSSQPIIPPQHPHSQLAASLAPEHQSALGMIPEPQRSAVLDLMARTNLNVKFAFDCLSNNEWNMDRAIANFDAVKATLGRDAYL
ncbi:hypothetical protein CC1G_10065 [Coprinopsis cinerea okayama7|uniref:NTF2-like protein n=1 Tax=Coprinopsis cinerea (strain Okayama-7 / 130 / ATCC MYA-4618 / FGSC 9003) TaxID=240176 RepID=A8NUZ6_COPC7|nr:hypothetical protein CC1G_10065 [Coprinopsis cinerea okayama7\|eukprot:XP_001836571.2 hypothetical protein CC1G_10065 [Coprinopsis cinerea okayama7\